jgi:hypothetical protein
VYCGQAFRTAGAGFRRVETEIALVVLRDATCGPRASKGDSLMRRWKLLTSFILTSMISAFASVEAATLRVAIDDESVEVPLRYVHDTTTVDVPNLTRPVLLGADGGYYVIGNENGEPWNWESSDIEDGGKITIGGSMDPDPSLIFGSVAFDFGAPSSFSFTFILPLAPAYPNPSVVMDSYSGSVTNGIAAGGVTVTALAPPPGIPVDGDGITEMEVYTLSDDGMLTWKNVGLDLGLSESVPLASFGSGLTGTYNEGPIATIAGGPWTHMRADINFSLSGGGDIFTFNGAKILIPEPGTFSLAILLFGCAWCSRRSAIR